MDTNVISTVMEVVVNDILKPALLLIGSAVLLIIKSYAGKITNSIVSKNATECMELITATKNNLIDEIDNAVSIGVSSTMSLAEQLKSDGHKLTAGEISMLNTSARNVVYGALPESLTCDTGSLSKLIGGKKSLNCLIDGLIEKHVLEQKSNN